MRQRLRLFHLCSCFALSSSGRFLISSPLTALDNRILELLFAHRVLTTTQIRSVVATPERTIDYRLLRLYRFGYVHRLRPYAERGSSPFHWWLSRSGFATVGEPHPVRGASTLNPLFLAHTSATAALCLALSDRGAASGIRLLAWRRDEDSWEDWNSMDLRDKSVGKMRPDALAELQLDGNAEPVNVFFEIDRGTMDHRRLASKVRRYCTYANAEAWRQRHQALPALALITTSEKRARRFLEGAARLALNSQSPRIAASWSVDDMAAAVSDSVWATGHDETPRTLRCILGEIAELQVHQQQAAMESQMQQADDKLLSAWRDLRQLVRASKQEWQIDPHIAAISDVVESLDPYGDRSFEWAQGHCNLITATLRSLNGAESPPQRCVQDWRVLRETIWCQQSNALVSHWRDVRVDHPQLRVTAMHLLTGRCATFRSLQRALSHRDDAEDAASIARYRERRSREFKTSSPFSRRHDVNTDAISVYDKRFLAICEGCGVRRHVDDGPTCPSCRSRLVANRDTGVMMTELARMNEGRH